jgi:hypothetical protein
MADISFIAACALAAAAWPDFRLIAGPAPQEPGWGAAGAGLTEAVPGWLAQEGAQYPGLDRPGQAAYVMSRLAFDCGEHFGALALAAGTLPELRHGEWAFGLERYTWMQCGETGEALRFSFTAAGSTATMRADPETLARLHDAVLAPCVEAVASASGLGRPALRRLVADGLANGVLYVGRELGREAEALALGRAALATPGVGFANRDTRYGEIKVPAESAPGLPALAHWFVLKGGCCRAYTLDGHDKCGTCVLLSEEEQRASLTLSLIRKALVEREAKAA